MRKYLISVAIGLVINLQFRAKQLLNLAGKGSTESPIRCVVSLENTMEDSTPRALRQQESGGHEVTDSQVRAPVLRFANVENDGKAARRNGGWSDPVLHLSGTTSSYGSLSHSSTQRTANIQGKGGANPVAIPSQSTKFLEPYKRRWRVTTL